MYVFIQVLNITCIKSIFLESKLSKGVEFLKNTPGAIRLAKEIFSENSGNSHNKIKKTVPPCEWPKIYIEVSLIRDLLIKYSRFKMLIYKTCIDQLSLVRLQ